MALPACTRCGKRSPQRMHGLMSLWFGPLIELEADLGYFYLCPACHDEVIVPELERIQNRILELHPAAQRQLEYEAEFEDELDAGAADEAETEADAEGEPPAGAATGSDTETASEMENGAEPEDGTGSRNDPGSEPENAPDR